MKRQTIITLILMSALLTAGAFAFTGCGAGDTESGGEEPTAASSEEPAPSLPEYNEANTWQGPVTRNLFRFPVFSRTYPSRRLNLEGDPEARAEVPGEKIWPEPDSSSPLKKKLGN